jgi:hypothetical protein
MRERNQARRRNLNAATASRPEKEGTKHKEGAAGQPNMMKAMQDLLTAHGWKYNEAKDIWTDPSSKVQGRIIVTVTTWQHLKPDITKQHGLGELAHGHSATDLAEYLKGL